MTKAHFSKPVTCLITRRPVTLKFIIRTRYASCHPVGRRLLRATCTGQSICGLLDAEGKLMCEACPHLPKLTDNECILEPRPVLPKRPRATRPAPAPVSGRTPASQPALSLVP